MRKLLPVVFCGIAAISYSAFAADPSVKADTDTKATIPGASVSNEGSATAGASTDKDKPAKRDMKKEKKDSKADEGASSGSSTGATAPVAPAAPATPSDKPSTSAPATSGSTGASSSSDSTSSKKY
jgi:hypothetical protein